MKESTSTQKTIFWIFFALITVMFIYATVASVGNVLGSFEIAKALELNFSTSGYVWAGFSILLPVILFVIVLLLGIGKSLTQKSILLFIGLTLSSAWYLNLLHFIGITNILKF